MIKVISVKVVFDGTPYKEYMYKTFEDLEVGDIVLVQARDTIALATVSKVDCNDSDNIANKFVIEKINPNKVDDLIEKYRRQKEIEEKLESRYREMSKMNLYKKIAETDEAMSELLKELEEIK